LLKQQPKNPNPTQKPKKIGVPITVYLPRFLLDEGSSKSLLLHYFDYIDYFSKIVELTPDLIAYYILAVEKTHLYFAGLKLNWF
jgi:hypothetical protein